MSATMLQLIRQATTEMGLSVPTSVAGNQTQDVVQLLGLLNAVGYELQREHQWQRMTVEYIFNTAYTQTTGNLTAGSAVVTGIPSTTGLSTYYQAVGTGINNATNIASVDSATQVTLTQPATESGTGVTLTFSQVKYPFPDDFDRLILPAEYEAGTRCFSRIGFVDPRIKEGELLWPKRYDHGELETWRKTMGSANYAAQVQQRPTAVAGSVFKRDWFARRYVEDPRSLVRRCTAVMQSWDCAFKDAETSSYVVGQVWGLIGIDRYLLAERREHLDFVATRNAIRTMSAMWPEADTVLSHTAPQVHRSPW